MYGPDPITIMARARMLAAEQERAERRRSRQPRNDDAADATATRPQAVPHGRLGTLRALLGHPAAALRWYGRLWQAS
jgi:hypothetical protein